MTNDIYTLYNIDKSKLKRDYLENPLKRYVTKCGNSYGYKKEYPIKEDLEYLYITNNIPMKELMCYFNISKKFFNKICREYNIKKDRKKIHENYILSNLKTYGVQNTSQLKEVSEKREQTCLKIYGVKTNLMTQEFKEKSIKTLMNNYGVKHPFHSKEIHDRAVQTLMDNYGVDCPSKSEIISKKIKNTNIKKYGVEYPLQSKEIQIKASDTLKKIYGVSHPSNIPAVVEKIHTTKKKNNTCNSSKPENRIFNRLKECFGYVERQYKSDLYPFSCDFYIPKKDLYIEYNGFWTHGFEPYIGTKEQIEKVKSWESKAQETDENGKSKTSYTDAINTWTKSDVLKRTTAKNNNLNYLEFFNMNEFNKWFEENNIKKDVCMI